MSFANFGPFEWVVFVCVMAIGLCVAAAMGLALISRDELTRTVISDVVFYGMLCMYLAWSLTNDASIVYDIALLAAIACGVLPTLSMARIISKGRR